MRKVCLRQVQRRCIGLVKRPANEKECVWLQVHGMWGKLMSEGSPSTSYWTVFSMLIRNCWDTKECVSEEVDKDFPWELTIVPVGSASFRDCCREYDDPADDLQESMLTELDRCVRRLDVSGNTTGSGWSASPGRERRNCRLSKLPICHQKLGQNRLCNTAYENRSRCKERIRGILRQRVSADPSGIKTRKDIRLLMAKCNPRNTRFLGIDSHCRALLIASSRIFENDQRDSHKSSTHRRHAGVKL